MERITGRSDDMIKVKGVAVFPSQIEKALLKVSDIEPHYQIIVTRPDIMDEIEIKVEKNNKGEIINCAELRWLAYVKTDYAQKALIRYFEKQLKRQESILQAQEALRKYEKKRMNGRK